MSPACHQEAAPNQGLETQGPPSISQARPLHPTPSVDISLCDPLPDAPFEFQFTSWWKVQPQGFLLCLTTAPLLACPLWIPFHLQSTRHGPRGPQAKQTNKSRRTSVLTRKRTTIAEAAGAGRWGKGLQGNTVLLLRAARLDGAQVAVAAGAEVAGQQQV